MPAPIEAAHGILRCQACHVRMAECRCPSDEPKPVTWSVCFLCMGKDMPYRIHGML
jgi:hypothetical protein